MGLFRCSAKLFRSGLRTVFTFMVCPLRRGFQGDRYGAKEYWGIKNKATNGRPYDVEKITYLTKHIKKQAQPIGCACFIKGKL